MRTTFFVEFLNFHDRELDREDLPIDVSITNVGLILTKLRWFQLVSTSQNSNQNSISTFFEKKYELFWLSML